MIAEIEPKLFKAAVFQSGAYDLKRLYETTLIDGIKRNIEREAGTNEKHFLERSSVYKAENYSCPILILHGEQDENYPVEQAEILTQKLVKLKKFHQTEILPNSRHMISKETRKSHTIPFLEKWLKNNPIP